MSRYHRVSVELQQKGKKREEVEERKVEEKYSSIEISICRRNFPPSLFFFFFLSICRWTLVPRRLILQFLKKRKSCTTVTTAFFDQGADGLEIQPLASRSRRGLSPFLLAVTHPDSPGWTKRHPPTHTCIHQSSVHPCGKTVTVASKFFFSIRDPILGD